MSKGKFSPEGEVIAAYGAAMVAAFQVLIIGPRSQNSPRRSLAWFSENWSLLVLSGYTEQS
jgi:hypothetical protein